MKEFWHQQAALGRYKRIAKLGLWYAEIIASSVQAERVFAIMRDVEDSKQLLMQFKTWRAEMMLRGNAALVRKMYNEELNQSQSPSSAATQAASSSSASAASAGGGGGHCSQDVRLDLS